MDDVRKLTQAQLVEIALQLPDCCRMRGAELGNVDPRMGNDTLHVFFEWQDLTLDRGIVPKPAMLQLSDRTWMLINMRRLDLERKDILVLVYEARDAVHGA